MHKNGSETWEGVDMEAVESLFQCLSRRRIPGKPDTHVFAGFDPDRFMGWLSSIYRLTQGTDVPHSFFITPQFHTLPDLIRTLFSSPLRRYRPA